MPCHVRNVRSSDGFGKSFVCLGINIIKFRQFRWDWEFESRKHKKEGGFCLLIIHGVQQWMDRPGVYDRTHLRSAWDDSTQLWGEQRVCISLNRPLLAGPTSLPYPENGEKKITHFQLWEEVDFFLIFLKYWSFGVDEFLNNFCIRILFSILQGFIVNIMHKINLSLVSLQVLINLKHQTCNFLF